MAGQNPAMVVKIAADLSAMRAALKEGTSVIHTTTAAMGKLASSFDGSKIIQHAHNVTAAVNQIGGASRLTAAEQARVNTVVEKAIEKYRVLGQHAPADMHRLADATKKVDDTTKTLAQTIGSDFKTKFAAMVAGFISAQAIIGGLRMAWGLLTDFVKDSIQSFSEAEAAQKRLTTALKAQGTATPETIKQFQALAMQFQRTTVYSDDLITEMQALLVQVGGVLPAQMQQALTASTNLASGLGIDLRAATMMVSKAFEDNFASLKKAGIEIDVTRAKTEGMAYVLGQINAKLGGQAAAEIDTYAGAMKQLGNEIDNLKEKVGELLVKGLELPIWLRKVSDAIAILNLYIEKNNGQLPGFIEMLGLLTGGFVGMGTAVDRANAAWKATNAPLASHLTLVKGTHPEVKKLAVATDDATRANQQFRDSVDRTIARMFLYAGQILPDVRSGYESWIQRGIEANGVLQAGIPLWYGTAAATRAVGKELDTGTFNLNAWILSLKQVPPELEKVAAATNETKENTAAAAVAWVQWSIQVVQALDRATQSASTAKNALSGALTGAQAGSQFGPTGTVIGALAGLFIGLIRSEDKLAAARQAAVDAIVKERAAFVELAGGITVLREKADLAGISLDKLFQFQANAAEFKAEIDRINAAFAAWEKRIAGLNQAAGGLNSMTSGFAAPFETALTKLDELKKSLTGLTGKELFAARVAIKQLEKDLVLMAAKGQQQFTNLGTYALATFAGMLKQTGSLSQAFDAVGPSLDALIKLQGSLGFTSSATVQELLNIRKVVTANQAVMQSVDGLNQVMAGLTAAGQINQALFTAFSQDATVLFAKLQAGGATGSQALALMQPTLQQLWQLQQTFGFAVDAGTQALIDQAVAQGIVGAKHKSVSDKMLEALLGIQGAVEALALVLTQGVGGALGDLGTRTRTNAGEWRTWGDNIVAEAIRAKRALDTVQPPSTSVPGPAGGGGVPSSATSTQTTSGRGGSSSSTSTTVGPVHVHVSGSQSAAQSQETAHIVANELIKLIDTNQGGARTKTRRALRVT